MTFLDKNKLSRYFILTNHKKQQSQLNRDEILIDLYLLTFIQKG